MSVTQQKKVLVAVSGGVDSAVCALLLREQGWDVYGAVLDLSPAHFQAVEDAREVCEQLSIPLTVIREYDLFRSKVILPFCTEYCEGKTPNPCIMCNLNVKFALISRCAKTMGIDYIATGHYARIHSTESGCCIQTAASAQRDQSYMLYRLPPSILSTLLLPLGELGKDIVRERAKQSGLSPASKPDSQEICFIPDNEYAAYIQSLGFSDRQGCFISPDGERLKAHLGVSHYTIGQRSHLGIALGKPVFVAEILDSGDIQLGWSESVFSSLIILDNVFLNTSLGFLGGMANVKIRSTAKPAPAEITLESDIATVRFAAPQRAAAPGQSAVFYTDEGFVLGGGIIKRTFR